ncbi:hypothetical protein [uncultured Polaribacter sp.]|uniref:hypothetical protein n=1 Tax=uncultured Polaribacter sp. TaxID=174711 RepID=UPI00261E37DE|nr:hypothetical protein [uncultured Polaribacter sp.]
MSTLEIRNEMLEIIQNEDENSLKNLYQIIKQYKHQKQLDKMIAEGEEDIKNGDVYNSSEVKAMLDNWVDND